MDWGRGNTARAGAAPLPVTTVLQSDRRARALPDDPQPLVVHSQWELSTLRHMRVCAGSIVTDVPGSLWALVRAGSTVLETAGGFRRLVAGDAVLIDARTAYRLIAVDEADVILADLRLVVPTERLPSPLVAVGFGVRHRGIAELVGMCPLDGTCHPALFFASYAGLIGAAMTMSWNDSTDTADDTANDAVRGDEQVAEVVASLVARPGEEWTLDRMAGLVHLSRSALTDRFRRAINRSPMQVLREIRMQEARRRLGDLGQSVTEVAFAVGYGSVAAFSRAFSSFHGVAPHSWRESSRAGGAERREPQSGRGGGDRARHEWRPDPELVEQRPAGGGAQHDGHLERGDLKRQRGLGALAIDARHPELGRHGDHAEGEAPYHDRHGQGW